MTPQQAAYKISLLADHLESGQDQLARETEADLLKTAQRWSSGPFSLSALADRDHPYATRHGRPLLSPRRVNVQSGLFRSSWVSKAKATEAGVKVQLYNADPKAARFLEHGTSKMFARPIGEAILNECAPRLQRRVDRMIKSALSKLS